MTDLITELRKERDALRAALRKIAAFNTAVLPSVDTNVMRSTKRWAEEALGGTVPEQHTAYERNSPRAGRLDYESQQQEIATLRQEVARQAITELERDAREADCNTLNQEIDTLRAELNNTLSIGYETARERDALRSQLENCKSGYILASLRHNEVEKERDALRAELAKTVARNVELEHKRGTLTAEVDRLDAIRRQQEQDNLDLIARLDAVKKPALLSELEAKIAGLEARCRGYQDALAMNRDRAKGQP